MAKLSDLGNDTFIAQRYECGVTTTSYLATMTLPLLWPLERLYMSLFFHFLFHLIP